ncbi:MAG: nucleotidyltransferase domain-containing protein [Methanobacteriota archaeon]
MKPPLQLYYVENINKVLAEESNILFAFLFGSYAKGTQDEKSDIDIAVYLKDESLLERVPLYPSRLAIKIETSSLLQYYDFKPHLEMYDAARRVRLGI